MRIYHVKSGKALSSHLIYQVKYVPRQFEFCIHQSGWKSISTYQVKPGRACFWIFWWHVLWLSWAVCLEAGWVWSDNPPTAPRPGEHLKNKPYTTYCEYIYIFKVEIYYKEWNKLHDYKLKYNEIDNTTAYLDITIEKEFFLPWIGTNGSRSTHRWWYKLKIHIHKYVHSQMILFTVNILRRMHQYCTLIFFYINSKNGKKKLCEVHRNF